MFEREANLNPGWVIFDISVNVMADAIPGLLLINPNISVPSFSPMEIKSQKATHIAMEISSSFIQYNNIAKTQ